MALTEGIDRAIFKGDAGPAGTGADIVGLQTAGISESTLTQSNKIKGDKILELFAGYIDGKHAREPGDVRIVTSVGSNVLWMTTPQAATVENQTIAQYLRASGVSWTTRGSIDTNTSNGDFGAYVGLAQGSAGAAVAAVWESASLIRDPYSGAKQGEVGLVLNTLWDFKLPALPTLSASSTSRKGGGLWLRFSYPVQLAGQKARKQFSLLRTPQGRPSRLIFSP